MNKFRVYLVAGIFLAVALFGTRSPAMAEYGQGKALFDSKCASCHGTNGNGQGPLASVFTPGPVDFTNPSFWQGNVDQKITNTVENGHGPMPALQLSPSQIKSIINYMSHTFK